MEQPGLVTSPRSHQPTTKHPQADSDNSIYFLGQGRLSPAFLGDHLVKEVVATKWFGLATRKSQAGSDVGHGNAAQGGAGCPTLTSDVSVVIVVVEGKLTDVTPGNWKVQGWNSEAKESLLFPFF